MKNLQGDIIGMVDAIGNTVVEYTYDSWGNVLSITGSLKDTVGVQNPFRYRGYYYDTETGMYYLQSRYYDPEIRRFISADNIISNTVLGTNVYCYCENNPVVNFDPSGHSSAIAISFAKVASYLFAGIAGIVTSIAVNQPRVKQASRNFVNSVSNKITSSIGNAYDKWEREDYTTAIKDRLDASFAKVKVIPWYQKQEQVHHIVAQNAKKALPAKNSLYKVKLNTEISQNKVTLKRGLHQRLHNTIYYAWINKEITEAAEIGQKEVINTLGEIRIVLEGWNRIYLF